MNIQNISAIPTKRLLIVEDSVDLQILLKKLFESEGYVVNYVSNGLEALNYLKAAVELPNLILLDLMMPVMDGYEFRKEQALQQRLANIPVVVMTADGNVLAKKLNLMARDYVKKPVDADNLLDVVKRNCS